MIVVSGQRILIVDTVVGEKVVLNSSFVSSQVVFLEEEGGINDPMVGAFRVKLF